MVQFQATVVDIVGDGPDAEVLLKIPPAAGLQLGPPGTLLDGDSVAGPNGLTVVFIAGQASPPPPPPPP